MIRTPVLVQIQPRNEEAVSVIWGRNATMIDLAAQLSQRSEIGRPVLDRTNLNGAFHFDLCSAPNLEDCFICARAAAAGAGFRFASSPTIFKALEQQAGLKLQAARAPVEVQVIDRVERPSDN